MARRERTRPYITSSGRDTSSVFIADETFDVANVAQNVQRENRDTIGDTPRSIRPVRRRFLPSHPRRIAQHFHDVYTRERHP